MCPGPKLRYKRETAAIKSIQTIHRAEVDSLSEFGHYATSLAELGPPRSGVGAPSTSGMRSFYSDQTMVVRENYGPEPAAASSREMDAGVPK